MTERYNVVCSGDIESGYTRQQVEKNLCTLFKAPLTKIQKTFFSGTSPTIVKKHVAHDMAVRYVAALMQAGIVTCVERSHDEQANMSQQKMIRHPTQNTSQPTDTSLTKGKPSTDVTVCPKCGYQTNNHRDPLKILGECPACGIILAKYQHVQAQKSELQRPDVQQLREQILTVLNSILPQKGVYVYPDIPPQKLLNAKRASQVASDDEVLGLGG